MLSQANRFIKSGIYVISLTMTFLLLISFTDESRLETPPLKTLDSLPATAPEAMMRRPVISGEWWPVSGNPDLGYLTGPRQQPVDFGIWKAGDNTWQIW